MPILKFEQKLLIQEGTRMHSSRMLTVPCSSHLLGSGVGCLPREGVSAQGDVCSGEGVCPGGCVCPRGVCLVCRGVSA